MPKDTQKNVIVTAGPTYEPIDEVRRITNFSTGRTGTLLAEGLAGAGFRVVLMRGEGASFRLPAAKSGIGVETFTTRESLKKLLAAHSHAPLRGLLHAAAIGDFEVNALLDKDNQPVEEKKISSGVSELKIHLKPAAKLIRNLRGWFPSALIVGWKYELIGKREQTLTKGWRQLVDCDTDGCVVNGKAYGDGFGFCTPPQEHLHVNTDEELIEHLTGWLRRTPPRVES